MARRRPDEPNKLTPICRPASMARSVSLVCLATHFAECPARWNRRTYRLVFREPCSAAPSLMCRSSKVEAFRIALGSPTFPPLPRQRRHGHAIGPNLHSRPHLLNAADNHRVVGAQAGLDHPQSVLLQFARRHAALLDDVVFADDIGVLHSLIGAERSIDHQAVRDAACRSAVARGRTCRAK